MSSSVTGPRQCGDDGIDDRRIEVVRPRGDEVSKTLVVTPSSSSPTEFVRWGSEGPGGGVGVLVGKRTNDSGEETFDGYRMEAFESMGRGRGGGTSMPGDFRTRFGPFEEFKGTLRAGRNGGGGVKGCAGKMLPESALRSAIIKGDHIRGGRGSGDGKWLDGSSSLDRQQERKPCSWDAALVPEHLPTQYVIAKGIRKREHGEVLRRLRNL